MIKRKLDNVKQCIVSFGIHPRMVQVRLKDYGENIYSYTLHKFNIIYYFLTNIFLYYYHRYEYYKILFLISFFLSRKYDSFELPFNISFKIHLRLILPSASFTIS